MFTKLDVIEMMLGTHPHLTDEMREFMRQMLINRAPADIMETYNNLLINHIRNSKTLKLEDQPKPGYNIEYIGAGLFSIKY